MPLEEEKEEPDRLPRVAAGVMDVFGVAAAALAIVVLLLMLGSLFFVAEAGSGDHLCRFDG